MARVQLLKFSIVIEAPVSIVWQKMFDEAGYRDWTSAFCEGSYFVGSWQQGEMIRFLSPSGNGMVATIAECRPLEYLSIKHLGFIIDGQDDFESEQVTSWAPAYENYHFRGTDGATELSIEQEIAPEYVQFMQDIWPKALQQLKRLCEQG